jgi:S-adenosylmethionine:tRNA ribosyltransferase-isomerase
MKTEALDYHLPEELIAQHPVEKRDESRLLVVNRATGSIEEDAFKHLPQYLQPGDALVLNDTQVIRARLRGRKLTGGKVEIFLLQEERPSVWRALVRPSAKAPPGTVIQLRGGITVVAGEILKGGQRQVQFDRPDVLRVLESIGELPLPPYIQREGEEDSDLRRYQTIYAAHAGAVAAPTAGLHFTEEVFASLSTKGIQWNTLTLHVGYGTFKPIQADTLEKHVVDAEEFHYPEETARLCNETRRAGKRVVAVGTTVTRVLESQYVNGSYVAGYGLTDRYIYPPYTFQAVDVLQTNFHLPKSSLLALVMAFAGQELTLAAYRYAVEKRFRFYSYGDAMLIL